MLDMITRRAAVLGAGAVTLTGVAASAAIAFSSAGGAAQIEAAAERCRTARGALTATLYAYERALPPPHATLDMTGHRPLPFTATVERRLFDGAVPKRGVDFLGNPAARYVATKETIEQDLHRCSTENRGRRRLLYRMRRRAKARAAKIEALEASFDLDELRWRVDEAEHALEELTQKLFEEPATSLAAVLTQAKALSVYADTMQQQYATYQAGRFGKVLADGLQNVARAA